MLPLRFAAAVASLALPLLAIALEPGRGVLQYHRTPFGVDKGLPNPNVTTILPAGDGRLWIGTQAGIALFDGTDFEVVDASRFPDLPNDLLAENGLAVDPSGDLWIALYGGHVFRLRGGPGGTLERVLDPQGPTTLGLFPIGAEVWLGHTAGAVRLSENGPPRSYGFEDGLPAGLTGMGTDASGRVYATTEEGLRLFEGDRFVRPSAEIEQALGKGKVNGAQRARAGGVWIMGPDRAVRIGEDGQVAERFGPDGIPGGWPLRCLEDQDGSLWLGAPEGIARVRNGRVEGPFGARDGLPSSRVDAMGEDREGNLWLGLYGVGLVRLRAPEATLFSRSEGLPDGEALAVAPGQGSEVWVGTPSGLYVIRGGRGRRVAAAPAGDLAGVTLDARGTLWAGSGRAITRLVGDRLEEVAELPAKVNALRFDEEGTLWIGTIFGLYWLRGSRVEHPPGSGSLADERINALELDPAGALWVVGEQSGAHRRVHDGFTPTPPGGPPAGAPRTGVLVDADGTLWLSTSGAGLWRLRGGTWHGFGAREGLPENTVLAVVSADAEGLWLTGDLGVHRVRRAELEEVAQGRARLAGTVRYALSDGTHAVDCVGGMGSSAARDRSGRLWVATTRGVAVVDASRPRREPLPGAILQRASADGAPIQLQGTPAPLGPGLGRLRIEFTGVNLGTPERLRLRYRLEGFDPDWVLARREREAQYTRLPPGAYRFVAQATLDGLTWGPESAPLAVSIAPHPWERPRYRFLAGCALLAAALVLHRLRVGALTRRGRELKAAVDRAVAEVRTLRGLLPVCAWCKKVRDDAGAWRQFEEYVRKHTHAEFSHGMCPDCFAKYADDEGES